MDKNENNFSHSIFGYMMGVVSREDILSGIRIGQSEQEKKNKGVFDSVNDPRLGSAVFNDKLCKTCGGDFKECVGHFGYIELKQPIFNPIFKERVQNVLQLFCLSCFTVIVKNYKNLSVPQLLQKSRFVQCQHCGEVQPKVKILFKDGVLETQLYPKQVKKLQQLNQINNFKVYTIFQVENFLNQINKKIFKQIFNVNYNPVDLIFSKCLPIPPPHIRAQLNQTLFTQGKAFQNQLSQLYQQVIKNVQLNQYKNVNQLICEIFGVLTDQNKVYNPFSFKEILDKKTGIIRLNVCQKRVCNAGRAVLGASKDLKPDEVQVPIYILKQLSIAVLVDQDNIKQMQKLLENRNKYPGLTYILRGEDKYNYLQVKQLQIGDIVGKNPQNGDYCLLSRQPILHLYSINYMRIREGFDEVIRINNSVSNPYAADFDGDEVNIFIPQNQQAINGALLTLTFDNRCTNLDINNIIFVPNHDTPFGLYIFTKYLIDKTFSFKEMQFLLQKNEGQEILKYKSSYTGREIWDYLFLSKMKQFKNLIPITNKDINYVLTEHYYKFGSRKTQIFLQNLMQFSFQVVSYYTFTLTVQQTKANLDFEILEEKYKQIENECQKVFLRSLKSQLQIDLRVLSEKIIISNPNSNVWNFYLELEKNILKYFEDSNSYVEMIKSGSKGKLNHLSTIQHTGMLNLLGGLFEKDFDYRYCCYNPVIPCGLKQNNCIFEGLVSGISSQSDFLTIISFGRDGFVKQKNQTKIPGYMERKNRIFCSTVTVCANLFLYINNQLFLNCCFAGNNINLKYQKLFDCPFLRMTQKEIQEQFLGCSEKFIQDVLKIKKLISYSNFYTNFNQETIYNYFRFPLTIEYIFERYDKKLSNKIVSQQQYEILMENFFNQIQIVSFVEGFEKMNEDKKIIFKLCYLSQLTYKYIQDNKIDLQCLIFILVTSLQMHEKYKVQPGEHVGLQCHQAFQNKVTQEAISAFHQTKVQFQSFNINWVEQLQKYLYIGSKIQLYYKLKFKEPFNKDIKYFQNFQKILKKIPFSLYYLRREMGIQFLPNSKNGIDNFDKQDCILLKKQHQSFNINYQPFNEEEINSFQFFVTLYLNDIKMQIDQIDINFVIYSISNYMSQFFKPICDVYLLKGKDNSSIQLRFNIEETSDIENISVFFNTQLIFINISIFQQQYNIEQLEIKKEKYMKILENGDYQQEEEYVIMIYDQIPKNLYNDLIQYSEIIDFDRSYHNDIKQAQKYLSIIQQQRLMFFLINEAHQQIVKHDKQLPQSVQMITQVMQHQQKLIPVFRFGLGEIAGADFYQQAQFETQTQNLVKGAVTQDFNSILNIVTDSMLNSKCMTGPQAYDLFIKKDNKQQTQNIENNKVKQGQIIENSYMADVIKQDSSLKVDSQKQNFLN